MGKLFSGGCAEASNFLVAGVPGQGGTLDNHFLDGKGDWRRRRSAIKYARLVSDSMEVRIML